MALELRNLDDVTRKFMLEEIDADIDKKVLYISERLNILGKQRYATILKENVKNGNDVTLANALHGMFNTTYKRRKHLGGFSEAKMPRNAPEMLAEGEFNRFYIRALCRIVMENPTKKLRVYRARYSEHPRMESECRIGNIFDMDNVAKLLTDLRENIGTETYFGVPNGPSSGLSVEII